MLNARNLYWHDTTNNTKGHGVLETVLCYDLVIFYDESSTSYHQQTSTLLHKNLLIYSPDFERNVIGRPTMTFMVATTTLFS